MYSMSSESIGSGGQSADASSISSCSHRSRPGCMCTWKATSSERWCTTTCLMEGVSFNASSAICLSGTIWPRR